MTSDTQDTPRVLEMVIARVQARLDGQMRDNDALDVKALGVLGADAAAIAVLVAVHTSINRFWWVPALGLAAAGLLFLAAIWPRSFDVGPNWREFYDTFGGGSASEVGQQMLAELLQAVEGNDEKAPRKNTPFKIGFAILAVSLVGCVPVSLMRPQSELHWEHGKRAASAAETYASS